MFSVAYEYALKHQGHCNFNGADIYPKARNYEKASLEIALAVADLAAEATYPKGFPQGELEKLVVEAIAYATDYKEDGLEWLYKLTRRMFPDMHIWKIPLLHAGLFPLWTERMLLPAREQMCVVFDDELPLPHFWPHEGCEVLLTTVHPFAPKHAQVHLAQSDSAIQQASSFFAKCLPVTGFGYNIVSRARNEALPPNRIRHKRPIFGHPKSKNQEFYDASLKLKGAHKDLIARHWDMDTWEDMHRAIMEDNSTFGLSACTLKFHTGRQPPIMSVVGVDAEKYMISDGRVIYHGGIFVIIDFPEVADEYELSGPYFNLLYCLGRLYYINVDYTQTAYYYLIEQMHPAQKQLSAWLMGKDEAVYASGHFENEFRAILTRGEGKKLIYPGWCNFHRKNHQETNNDLFFILPRLVAWGRNAVYAFNCHLTAPQGSYAFYFPALCRAHMDTAILMGLDAAYSPMQFKLATMYTNHYLTDGMRQWHQHGMYMAAHHRGEVVSRDYRTALAVEMAKQYRSCLVLELRVENMQKPYRALESIEEN